MDTDFALYPMNAATSNAKNNGDKREKKLVQMTVNSHVDTSKEVCLIN